MLLDSGPLVDVHAHLTAEDFDRDREAVLGAAAAANVQRILVVSETFEDAQSVLALAARYPLIRPCLGLHPVYPDASQVEPLVELIVQHQGQLAAIGEVGLDYWIIQNETEREMQRKILARFVALSNDLELPLNVHSRSAGRHAIAWLKDCGARSVLLHAFDGKASAALEGLEAGYYFSIPPSLVRSAQKQKLVRQLPLDRILLESDAPVLGPTPAERNEPKNIALTCEAIARLKQVTPEDVAARSTKNARHLFPRAFI